MLRHRFALTAAVAALAAGVLAPTADAANSYKVVAAAHPTTPQFDPAGNIPHTQFTCAAADPNAVFVTVQCGHGANSSHAFAQANGPAAFAQDRYPVHFLNYQLCVTAKFHYADRPMVTVSRCSGNPDGGVQYINA